jgi:2'-5' RNA ligase
VVENLALDEGESAKQLHVTLAYLGETSEYSEQLVGNLHEIVASWAEGQSKFTATVQGVGTFLPAEEDGQHVLWASIGAPGLHRVHTSLVDYLKGHGYDPRENHGFVAHLTLAYSPYHFRFMPKVKRQEFRVHEIWCCIAGRWESITLKGDVRN